MKSKNILTLIIAALIFVACNQNSKKKEISTDAFVQDFEPQYVGGYPTNETVEVMFEEYDYQAAV